MSFKRKLNDQDYMELVCENGRILAKSPRPKNNGSFHSQRTQSLLDLYETEYDEGFMIKINNNLGDTQVVPVSNDEQTITKTKSSKVGFEMHVSKSNKRFEVITTPPDEQSAAVGRSTELYFASSSRGTSRDLSFCPLKKKYGDIDEEESTYLSNRNSDNESDDAKTKVPARTRKTVTKRKRSTEVHKLSERNRRNEMNKKMRALQDLLPNCYKDHDKVSLLDEAIKYMRTLQFQVQMMGMGNGLVRPPMMLPMGHYSPMSLGMHMGPQFLPQGTGFPGINNDAPSQMLNFLNQPTGLISNPPIFSPLESFSPQFAVPSCVPQAQTQATSFT